MGEQELKDIIEKHRKWLYSEPGGERADLRSADLRYADLRYADLRSADLRSADLRSADLRYANLRSADLRSADLRYADLRSADLSSADLSYADLRSANLSYANLSSANLSSANLSLIKKDFFERLIIAKKEVVGLYDYLQKGLVDGRSYEGECACFVGSIAKLTNEPYKELSCGLKPESESPTEKWFLAILKGDTPQSNSVSKITCEWIEEFAKDHSLVIPKYKIVSSAEAPQMFT